MNDIERQIDSVCNSYNTMGGLSFNFIWSGKGVTFRPEETLRN
jgi:hypothetical protein